MKIYIIGSMKNPIVRDVAALVRRMGHEAYDDWHASGPDCDDYWQTYCRERNLTYQQALTGYHAKQVFHFDKHHLDTSDAAILVMPAGRSGHMELGYMAGNKKPALVLFDKDPDRYDIMYLFAHKVCMNMKELEHEIATLPICDHDWVSVLGCFYACTTCKAVRDL